jgi:hypothetical protein
LFIAVSATRLRLEIPSRTRFAETVIEAVLVDNVVFAWNILGMLVDVIFTHSRDLAAVVIVATIGIGD